mmetsp:Transcript_35486/g.76589  ORF Transcript_35486/g.76589 Transcript_35486/m.76589 type:complete len:700 (-) Transcript_35486:459-2558(-)
MVMISAANHPPEQPRSEPRGRQASQREVGYTQNGKELQGRALIGSGGGDRRHRHRPTHIDPSSLSIEEVAREEALPSGAGAEVGREDQRDDGLELHHDVQGGSRGVLEGVADGVALHGRVVGLPGLACRGLLHLGLGVLHVAELGVLGEAALDVLLAVVPGAARVGHGDGQLNRGHQGTGEKPEDGLDTEEGAGHQRRADDQGAWGDHLLQGGLRGDGDASVVVGLDLCAAAQDGLALAVRQGELPLHLLHHLARGLAHGLHGQGGEPVGDHGADEQEGEGDGLQDIDAGQIHGHVQALQSHNEGAVEGQTHQSSRADGESLADGSRGVASGVQSIGAITNIGRELRQLSDASGVVGNGSEAVDGQAGGQGREHAQGSQCDAVQIAEGEGHVDVGGQDEDGDDAALVAQGHAEDHVHCRAGLAGGGQLSHGNVGVGGVVLGDQSDEETADRAHGSAGEGLAGSADHGALGPNALQGELLGEHLVRQEVGGWQHQDGCEDHLHLQDLLDVLLLLHGADVRGHVGAEHTDHDASGGDAHREEQGVPASGRQALALLAGHAGSSDDQGCAGGLREGTEQIGTHAGDVADIVSDVVRNGGRVVGIVLFQARHDLADEIGTNVGGLGVDATAHAAEHGHGAAAEAVASDAIHQALHVIAEDAPVDGEEHPEDQHTEGAEQVAHDATSSEGHVEGLGVAILLLHG